MAELSEKRHLKIPSVLDRVPEACAFVVAAAEAAQLDQRAVYHVQMAVDEWCTNVVEHGFVETGRRGWIDVTCETLPREFRVNISDDGPSFDPTTLAEVDPSLPLEDRQPGGLGWFFIKKIMDDVLYQFKDGQNQLTLIKRHPRGVAKQDMMEETNFPVHEQGPNIWVLTPNGRLDSTVSRQLETAVNAVLDAGRLRLIIDMSNVTYISSSGLKILLMARRKAQMSKGIVILVGLSARVFEIFEISGFDTIFKISETVEEAGAYIAALKSFE